MIILPSFECSITARIIAYSIPLGIKCKMTKNEKSKRRRCKTKVLTWKNTDIVQFMPNAFSCISSVPVLKRNETVWFQHKIWRFRLQPCREHVNESFILHSNVNPLSKIRDIWRTKYLDCTSRTARELEILKRALNFYEAAPDLYKSPSHSWNEGHLWYF